MIQSLEEFKEGCPSEEELLEQVFIAVLGEGERKECPYCHHLTRWYRLRSMRAAYTCQWCGWNVHPLAGTPLKGTRTPLATWLYADHILGEGGTAKDLQRKTGITYKAAWRMMKIVREGGLSIFEGAQV